MIDPVSAVIAGALGVASILVLASPRFAEPVYRPILFEPQKYPDGKGDWSMSWLDGREFEDVYLKTKKGSKLHGWFFPQSGAKASILVNHGNAGNIADLQVLIELLLASRVNVFVYDYRGFGKSEASPSVAGICEDGEAAFDWLRARTPELPIIVYGESLGGAVSCQLALRRPISGLILQSTFQNIRRIACDTNPIFHMWPPALFTRPYFDNAGIAARLSCPLLVIHGVKDQDVRIEHAMDLFAGAAEPKRLVMLPHTRHDEIDSRDARLFVNSIVEFITMDVLQRFEVDGTPVMMIG